MLDSNAAARELELRPLPADFYDRPTLEVAPMLLGKILATRVRGVLTAGRIVEVEAYLGESDRASHARYGKTARTAPMFGPPGHAYVYLIYGMHHCVNVVTERRGVAGAVLVRALEPLAGLEAMARRRGIKFMGDVRALASGPGKLCQALAIDRTLSGSALDAGHIILADGDAVARRSVATSPRIGVDYAGEWAALPYRFFWRDHPCVSRYTRRPA